MIYGGFLSHRGTPIAGLFFFMEDPTVKWMILGYPRFRKPPYGFPKSWRYPQIIQVTRPFLVLKPMGDLGIPHFSKSQYVPFMLMGYLGRHGGRPSSGR